MIYTFKSKATGNVIMLEPTGRRVLEIIGKDPASPKGIVLPEQMPAAIAALQEAIRADEARRAQSAREAATDPDATMRGEDITLRQRARPFIEMLERSLAEKREVVWGV